MSIWVSTTSASFMRTIIKNVNARRETFPWGAYQWGWTRASNTLVYVAFFHPPCPTLIQTNLLFALVNTRPSIATNGPTYRDPR